PYSNKKSCALCSSCQRLRLEAGATSLKNTRRRGSQMGMSGCHGQAVFHKGMCNSINVGFQTHSVLDGHAHPTSCSLPPTYLAREGEVEATVDRMSCSK